MPASTSASTPQPQPSSRPVLHTLFRILTLRFSSDDLHFTRAHLIFGLACTWLAGIGRYWDHPRPHLLQQLGLGSVIYIFVLSLFLWLITWPLRPKNWSYRHLLVFVSFTSPPALLYAVPVERFLPMPTAQAANAWFLAIVAVWRVALYFRYLRVWGKLHFGLVALAGLLPLGVIITALFLLNLEHVLFDLMAGIQDPDPTGGETRYSILFTLTLFSVILTPILFAAYLITILVRFLKSRRPIPH